MDKVNQASLKPAERRRSEEEVFKETIAALDRFNKYMLEAGYKVSKDVVAEASQANNAPVKQAKPSRKLKKAA